VGATAVVAGVNAGGGAAVAPEVVGAADETESEPRCDVCESREGDEEGLGEGGLVDLAGEEEVGFRGWYGACC
jgi:hypothetical protein